MPGAGVALAMPMLTVVTIGPADHCATFRRIVSATASVRGGMARQQHRKLLAPEPRGTVPARHTESEMQIAMPTSTWSPVCSNSRMHAPGIVAAALNGDSRAGMS
jgi:hypothetical protein